MLEPEGPFGENHVDRLAREPSGDVELVQVDPELLRPHEGDQRRTAEDDGAGQLLAFRLVLLPVDVAAGAAHPGRHPDHQPVRRLQRGAVGSHVLHAGLGIAGDHVGRRQRRRAVEAGRRDRDRQRIEPVPFSEQFVALDHDLLTGRGVDPAGRYRLGEGAVPLARNLVDRRPHADAVDRAVGRQRADHHRDVVAPVQAVGHVAEQEGAALVLVQPAAELPAHQRHHLGVLVDRLVHGQQQPGGLEGFEMFLQIGVAAVRARHGQFSPYNGGRAARRHDATARSPGQWERWRRYPAASTSTAANRHGPSPVLRQAWLVPRCTRQSPGRSGISVSSSTRFISPSIITT